MERLQTTRLQCGRVFRGTSATAGEHAGAAEQPGRPGTANKWSGGVSYWRVVTCWCVAVGGWVSGYRIAVRGRIPTPAPTHHCGTGGRERRTRWEVVSGRADR